MRYWIICEESVVESEWDMRAPRWLVIFNSVMISRVVEIGCRTEMGSLSGHCFP